MPFFLKSVLIFQLIEGTAKLASRAKFSDFFVGFEWSFAIPSID